MATPEYKGRELEITQESFSPKVVVVPQTGGSSWLRDKVLMGYREIPAGALVQRLQSGLSIRSSAEKT